MQLSTFALALGLASLASCQSLNGLPDCAKSCVTEFTSGSQIGGCPSLNVQCICSSSGFLSNIACCLAGTCDAADQATSVQFAQNLCKSAGVTNLPAAVSCVSSSTAAIGTAASSAATSAGSSATSGTTTATGSSITATGASTTAAVQSSGESTSSSATASATKNAGSHNMINAGAGVLGGLAAAVLI